MLAVKAHVRTELTATDIVQIKSKYRDRCTVDTTQPVMLDGTNESLPDPLFNLPLDYWIVEDATVREAVNVLMGS